MVREEEEVSDTESKGANTEELAALFKACSDEADADLFLYAGDLNDAGQRDMAAALRASRSRTNIVLMVGTYGGTADSGYRIARSIRRVYDKGTFTLLVHCYCKSAGTLLALAADRIVMTDEAELGPLDVQIAKRDEVWERTSGLTAIEALTVLRGSAYEAFLEAFADLRRGSGFQITTRTAADISAQLAIGLFAPVYAQIDPMRVAETRRAMDIAVAYGSRIKTPNVKKGTLRNLIDHYPDHGFVIDRQEAAELFEKVEAPSESQSKLLAIIGTMIAGRTGSDKPLVQYLPHKSIADKELRHEQPKGAAEEKPAAVPSGGGGAPSGNGPEPAPGRGRRNPTRKAQNSGTPEEGALHRPRE